MPLDFMVAFTCHRKMGIFSEKIWQDLTRSPAFIELFCDLCLHKVMGKKAITNCSISLLLV